MSEPQTHTPEQIEAWLSYERIRKGGSYNMFDSRARQATGLSREEYLYCMKNFASLRDAAAKPREKA